MADGRVVNASGIPLADISVSAYDETMRVTTRTDATGCFHLARICSPFRHKVPLRIGDPGAAPVDMVDGPALDLHLLITVLNDQVPVVANVRTGANVDACRRQGRTTLSNPVSQRTTTLPRFARAGARR